MCLGLLISEGTFVSKEAYGFTNAPGIYNDDQVEGWKLVTESVHNKGAIMFCQLWHTGRAAHSSFQGIQPIAPSAIAIEGETYTRVGKVPYEVPRAVDASEIPRIVEDFRLAAANAKKAGFDGVEIHSANGYLLDTFLQSSSNKRSDEYGGPVENRFQIHRQVIEAIKTVYPSERIGIRFSPNGNFNQMGSEDNLETFSYAISEVNKLGLGYIHLMDGTAFGFHNKCPQFRLYDARKLYNGVLIGNCGYTKETAEGAVGTGCVDMIAFGRLYISNPDLVERFKNNWPLAPHAPYEVWYSHGAKGYSDFPNYDPSTKDKAEKV